MADNIELNAGSGGATLATDDAGVAGHVQVVKLALSADASATPITADASGLLVNLGANNDVTVTGTVDLGATDNAVLDAIAASVAGATPAGTNNIGDVDVLTIAAGDNNIGNVDIVTVPAPLSTTGSGTEATALRVTLATDSTGLVSVDDNAGSLTVDNAALSVVGGGLEATALRVTIANDSTGVVSVDDGGGALTVDGTVTANLSATDNAVIDAIQAAVEIIDNAISGTEMQVDVVAALPAGTNAIGKLAANSGVDIGDVDVTSIAAGTNSIGNVGIIPRTTGGMTIFRSLDIDESEEEIKATAGQLFSISAFNTTAAPLFLKFYNATAANVTVGTTTPVLTFVVPGNADSDGAGFVWNNPIGFAFATAICVACTTGVADNDTGAPGANACVINIGYA